MRHKGNYTTKRNSSNYHIKLLKLCHLPFCWPCSLVLLYIHTHTYREVVMVNGMMLRRYEDGPSRDRSGEEDEEYVEDGDGSFHGLDPCTESLVQSSLQSPWPHLTPLNFTPMVSLAPLQWPEVEEYTKLHETTISTTITWHHKGHQVAIEGSWDNWANREYLQGPNGNLTITKVLPVGVYQYLFFVDGHRKCAPDLPRESDDKGDIFNVLDLQKLDLEREYITPESESSPISSYNNEYFSLKDFEQIVPALPPFLQNTPLNQPQSSDDPRFQEKLVPCVFNHLFTNTLPTGEPVIALTSTQRFREKCVTLVLYKNLQVLNFHS